MAQGGSASRAAAAAQRTLSTASAGAAQASVRLTKAVTGQTVGAAAGERATKALSEAQARGVAVAVAVAVENASASQRAASAQTEAAGATHQAGEAAETSYRRFIALERAQNRGAAAGRALECALNLG